MTQRRAPILLTTVCVTTLLAGVMLVPSTSHAAPDSELRASNDTGATNVSLALTRLLVPVIEARFEHAPNQKWSLAALVAYGGDLETATFAEISVFGLGARAAWLLIGDRRIGLGVSAEVRWESHIGVSPQLGSNDGFDFDLGAPRQSGVITRLEAERTIIAGGAGLFARASRRRLFAELSVGAGWQHSWTKFVQNEQQVDKTASEAWLPWSISVGLWL